MGDGQWRLRDPIHGLIVFDGNSETDRLAWELIQTPEFQRLRRIRQLGISEFVFPGATHTRFCHSIGVYHCARRLMEVIEREEGELQKDRAHIILIAALLHDIGHGPFSHAFENARQSIAKSRGEVGHVKRHELLTAELIQDKGGNIYKILKDGLANQVAELFSAEDPKDIYHAVVSSSFDADRMDYLLRDRYMTGTGAGAIDRDWLLDNLTTYHMPVPQDENGSETETATFVFKAKGRQAAEDFLLARYRLYTQVYLHKTTRGFEQLLIAFLRLVGENIDKMFDFGLSVRHPLVQFLRPAGDTVDNYRNLDDMAVWSAIECLRDCKNTTIARIAERLWLRHPLKVLDICSEMDHDESARRNALRRLKNKYGDELGKKVFLDETRYDLYSVTEKPYKAVRVKMGNGSAKQVHQFPDTIINQGLTGKTEISRFYFFSSDEVIEAQKVMKG